MENAKLFIPRFNNIYNEAEQLHDEFTQIRSRCSAKSWNDIMIAALRAKTNGRIQWWRQYLSKSEKEWLIALRNGGITILTEGWLRIPRWEKKKGRKEKLILQKVAGINSALRMQDHILNKYNLRAAAANGEIPILESIEEIIAYANYSLNDWKNLNARDKLGLQKKLAAVILRLEHCRNEFKVGAREQIEKTALLKDAAGRLNPSAMAARTIAALNRLSQRFNQLGIIIPHIAMRKELLVLEKRRLQAAIKKATEKNQLLLRHPVFTGGPIRKYEINSISERMGLCLFSLNNISISPYWEQAQQAKNYLREAKKIFNRSYFIEAKPFLENSLAILKTDLSQHG